MTKTEIEENNKLIAEFMGASKPVYKKWKVTEGGYPVYPEKYTGEWFITFKNSYPFEYYWHPVYEIEVKHLLFHKSWDWLMPVVGKIASQAMYYLTLDDDNSTNWSRLQLGLNGAKVGNIKLVYKTIVEFIKWYNNEKFPKEEISK